MSDRKRAVDILSSLICSHVGKKDMINELLDNIIELVKEEVPRWTFAAKLRPEQPQLIQGYTAENWQVIIDGGYLCEFSDFMEAQNWMIGPIAHKGGVSYAPFHNSNNDTGYKYCRPAQLKGVMRPIFVEPVDGGNKCMFFNKHSDPLGSLMWSDKPIFSKVEYATKYIEL